MVPTNRAVVGSRVRIANAIYEGADDVHPTGYLALKGDVVTIRKIRDTEVWLYSVNHDNRGDQTFAVGRDEVEFFEMAHMFRSTDMLERQLDANRKSIRYRNPETGRRHYCHLEAFRAAFVRDVLAIRTELRRRKNGR